MFLSALALPILLTQTGKLQIKDTVLGSGEAAQVGDVIKVEYTGKLKDGKVFDSSVGNEPFEFQLGVGRVIPGWDQGVLGLKVGGKRSLVIPSALGYGSAGSPPAIPGGATLHFDVKLISIAPRSKVTTLKPGTGAGAKVGDSISLHYRGTLADGKEFDSSYKRNQPMDVVLGRRVIPGFTQGLLGIKTGEKRKVVIPAVLAYGPRAIPEQDTQNMKAGSIIPANSDLTFEIEAVSVKAGGK